MHRQAWYEEMLYALAVCAVLGAVAVLRRDGFVVASEGKYVIAAWIIVRVRRVCISLPLATLVVWGASLGIPLLADQWRGKGPLVFPEVTSFPVHFGLITAALYCCACYAAASVLNAMWSQRDRRGRIHLLIALVSIAQLALAISGILWEIRLPYTTPFTYVLCGVLGLLVVTAVLGFILGPVPSIRTVWICGSWFQIVMWISYLLVIDRFGEMTYGRWRSAGHGGLFIPAILILILCIANILLARYAHRVQSQPRLACDTAERLSIG